MAVVHVVDDDDNWADCLLHAAVQVEEILVGSAIIEWSRKPRASNGMRRDLGIASSSRRCNSGAREYTLEFRDSNEIPSARERQAVRIPHCASIER